MTETMLLIIYPEDRSKSGLTGIAMTAKQVLVDSTGHPPHFIHPDATCLCAFAQGDIQKTARNLELALGNDVRWLLVRCDMPIESFGLSASNTWFRNRAGRGFQKSQSTHSPQ